jgi:hypothetical protein
MRKKPSAASKNDGVQTTTMPTPYAASVAPTADAPTKPSSASRGQRVTVSPAPAPRAKTATMGAAARPICSADCAARLDQARRPKEGGRLMSPYTGLDRKRVEGRV